MIGDCVPSYTFIIKFDNVLTFQVSNNLIFIFNKVLVTVAVPSTAKIDAFLCLLLCTMLALMFVDLLSFNGYTVSRFHKISLDLLSLGCLFFIFTFAFEPSLRI